MPKVNDFQKKTLSSLNNLNKRVLSIETRLAAMESSGIPKSSSGTRTTAWILLVVGIFFIIFGGFVLRSIWGRSVYSSLFSPLGWLLAIIAIIMFITTSSKSSGSKEEYETDEVEEKEEILEEAPVKSSTSRSTKSTTSKEVKQDSGAEANIGMKWFARIGIISLVLSVAFFIIYAIQNKIIGPTGQIAIGVLISLILLGLGEFFDRKEGFKGYARTLTGGGFAILYFAIYSAYVFYKLIPYEWLDLILLSIIIIFAIIFSLKYNSSVIAAEAFFLGYLAPIIVGNVTSFSLMYSVLLSIALVFISFARKWTYLSYGGLIFSYLIHAIWLGNNYNLDSTPLIHSVFLIIYIIIFTILAISMKKVENKDSSVVPNSFVYIVFALGFLFMLFINLSAIYLISLILMIFGALFLIFSQRLNYLALIAILGSYFIQWSWLGRNFTESDIPSHMVFVTIYFVLFNIASFINKDNISNVITTIINSFFYLGLMLVPILKFYPDMDGLFSLAVAIFYLIVAYIAYNQDKKYIFNTFAFLCISYLALAVPLQLDQNWVTISWAIEAILLLLLSFRLQENVLRILSSIVAGLTSFKLLVYDSWALGAFTSSDILGSTRLFSFLFVIVILYIMALIYSKNKKMFDDYDVYEKYVAIGLSIAATALTTIIFTIEIAQSSGLGDMKQMWISIAWIIQALVILIYGFASSKRVARIMGIVLFFISIFKIFLFDLRMLDTIYRIISFFVLGVILLIAAYLYYKFKEYI